MYFFIFMYLCTENQRIVTMYYQRQIDQYLTDWAKCSFHKPLLLRGARQVGKSTAIRHLGEQFESFVEINLERNPKLCEVFQGDLDVKRIVSELSAMVGNPIIEGKTLLFIDEIQSSPEAIMSLRFFKEDLPELHVVAAGSLLEFAIQELPTFGVGRIHSMFMYPMSFDEFLMANGEQLLMEVRDKASGNSPLSEPLYEKIVSLFRTFMIVGGMPEAVGKWVETHDYLKCQEVLDDIALTYEDDFPKYKKRVDPLLLRATLRSAAEQAGSKFVYSAVGGGYKTREVKMALDLLVLAGILIPVTHTAANGIPLGSEADRSYRKMLLLDTGLMLRMLNMSSGDITPVVSQVLTASPADLVNKGPLAEMMAGLEMLHLLTPNLRHELYYWQRLSKSSLAEVDYVTSYRQKVLPIEVKAGTQGGMKSLWLFMRKKNLSFAVRCSLENFGSFEYVDSQADGALRHVTICPLYAMSQMPRLLEGKME